MPLTLVDAPTVPPVSLEELRAHARVTSTEEDAILDRLIRVATSRCERELRRALITQTWEDRAPWFPANGVWRIPKPPLQTVTFVKYLDAAGASQTFAASGYVVDTFTGAAASHGRVVLADGASWPDLDLVHPGAAFLRFVAGYGDTPETVPEDIRHGILLLAAHLFEQREPVTVGGGVSPVPMTVDYLWSPYRALVW